MRKTITICDKCNKTTKAPFVIEPFTTADHDNDCDIDSLYGRFDLCRKCLETLTGKLIEREI